MEKLKFIIGAAFIAFLFQACQKDNPELGEDVDWFAFSIYYCECFGDCSDIFKIEDDQLFQSENTSCVVDDFDFNNLKLSQEKFEIAKELFDVFPNDLFDKNGETFGCPDCGDWGGHIIAMKKDGIEYSWNIDNMKNDLPDILLPFKEKLDSTLAAMR